MFRVFIPFVLFATIFSLTLSAASQDNPIRIDFSGSTAEENGVTVMGAGFGDYPLPSISFGSIPTDKAFEGATDGEGASIVAAPGEGILIIGSEVATSNPAMIRCSVRTDNPNVSVIIASLDNGPHTFVTTQTVNDAAYFLNQYKRLTTFYVPPSGSFKPLIQIINTSESETAIISLDNFDVFIFDPKRFYSTGFIDGDESDPSLISVSEDDLCTPIDEVTPTPMPPTPTNTPFPEDTPTPTTTKFTGETITISLDLPDEAKPLEIVFIQAGTFMMGSSSSEKDQSPNETQHEVILTKDFYIGKYEITQAQYEAVMGSNPTHSYGVGPDHPVYYISWYDAAKFCNRLSESQDLQPVYTESGDWSVDWSANGFRLPTEAEWEYACRAGTQTAFYWGEDSSYSQIGEYASYNGNSAYTYEVGAKLPNAWGLFDMSGNVFEWCQDWYGDYSTSPQIDPTGAVSGSNRVYRGGGWLNLASTCRSANRLRLNPDYWNYSLGFRLALSRTE